MKAERVSDTAAQTELTFSKGSGQPVDSWSIAIDMLIGENGEWAAEEVGGGKKEQSAKDLLRIHPKLPQRKPKSSFAPTPITG